MKKGFTLIELLVVVLIIGILAAVALPQYTKAVEKSRTAEAMQLLGDIATAEQIYYMANNKFTTDDSKLDLQFPSLTTNSYVVTLAYDLAGATSGTAGETTGIKATAKRDGGAYDKDVLTITVAPSGAVTRNASANMRALAPTWTNTTAAAENKAS